jgi:hypothetical protein
MDILTFGKHGIENLKKCIIVTIIKTYILLSTNIMVTKSLRMKWVGHAACAREMKKHTKFKLQNTKERGHLEY